MTPPPVHPRAFTLVELIVASVILSFIVAATTVSLSQSLRARDAATSRSDAFFRAATAVDRIARDAECAVRDPVIEYTRVAVTPSGSADRRADSLLLFSRSMRRVRPSLVPGGAEPAEGGEYEVQYRLQPPPRTAGGVQPPGQILWRRADPVPDDYPDGGGVAAPVVGGILSLTIQASNGVEWFDAWDSDYSGMPHALRITVVATDGRARTTAVARRTVALDRTPLPLETASESATDSSGGATTAPAP